MDGIDTIFSREGMTFQEAVDYFKERVPVTADTFYKIAEEYRALGVVNSTGFFRGDRLRAVRDVIAAGNIIILERLPSAT